jgi:hypothetical protein
VSECHVHPGVIISGWRIEVDRAHLWGSEPSRSVDELARVGIDEEPCTRNLVPIHSGGCSNRGEFGLAVPLSSVGEVGSGLRTVRGCDDFWEWCNEPC